MALPVSIQDGGEKLLERGAGDCGGAAVGGVTDDAAFIAEKCALAGLSHSYRLGHNRVVQEAGASADCRRCVSADVGEEITALGGACRCRIGQNWVHQEIRAANCNSTWCSTHCRQSRWELNAPRRSVCDRRRIDGAN